jgi:ABC-type tungstate transport system substrate-binding protein
MFAVLFWPLLHEWSVTLALGVGFFAMVGATFWAFPEVRKGWWAAGTLLNPALAMGLMLGQLPFMWASAMLLAGMGCWRRDRKGWAIAWITLAQITHAPILVPLVGIIVLLRLGYEPDRRGLLGRWLVSVALSLPAIVLVVISPVTSQTGPLISLWIEVETLFLRSFVVIVPVGMVLFQHWSAREHVDQPARARRLAPAIFALLIFGQVVIALGAGMRVGWGAMVRDPDPAALTLPRSAHFEPGKTYRVLSQADGKYAPYAAVRAGANLDSEFFPESLNWRSFKSEHAYAKFLTERKVDFVAVYQRYDRRKTNEHELLDRMHACTDGITISRVEHTSEYDLYAVERC